MGRAALSLVLLVVTLTGFQNIRANPSDRLADGTLDPRGFSFMGVDRESNEPVRYNACEPIHYVINPALAPAGGVEDVHTAVEMTAKASGLKFIYDGETDEPPSRERPPHQPDRYGDRWAPVLIAWMSGPPSSDPAGASGGSVVGVGGSSVRLNDEDRPVYLSGQITLDATADLAPGFGGRTWGQVILHELGHVVGLDHVDDPRAVMNDRVGLRPASWGPGDRAGLWELGVGSPCVSAPRP